MSYDISIADYDRNLTWNGNEIYFHYLNADKGIRVFNGMTGRHAIPLIETWLNNVQDEQNRYGSQEFLNKYTNGQGNNWLSHHLVFMFAFYQACVENPNHVISVQ